MEQVILNLAINARDAMSQSGTLTIETSNVNLDEDYIGRYVNVSRGQYVLLAVSDTGCGMSEETQSHIFEPFFTTKGVAEGTGLGLSTVYGIVKQSGGSIWVYSEIDKGTTFKIYLPRVDSAADDLKQNNAPLEMPHGTETILLAEDDELVRGLAKSVLDKLGYHVIEAVHGGAAMLISEQHEGPVQLLLTDVVMPEMSGLDLAGRLALMRPEMRVLYMSGYTDTAIYNGILDHGANFVQKPFSPSILAVRVREVLDEAPVIAAIASNVTLSPE